MNATDTDSKSAALAHRLDEIMAAGDLNQADLARLFATRPHVISRWLYGHQYPKPRHEARINDLHYLLLTTLAELTPGARRLWLLSRSRALGGKTIAETFAAGLAIPAELEDKL